MVQGPAQRVLLPGLGVYGALTPTLGLFAGAYRGFSPAIPSARPDASRPELAVNYEAGARLSRPRLRAEAIGFFNDYQNLTSVCTIRDGCGPTQEGMQSRRRPRPHLRRGAVPAWRGGGAARLLHPGDGGVHVHAHEVAG